METNFQSLPRIKVNCKKRIAADEIRGKAFNPYQGLKSIARISFKATKHFRDLSIPTKD